MEYFKAFQQADRDSDLYNRGMVREPEGKFEYDAMRDNLPAVSWIIPTSTQSEHPEFMPAAGAAFVASKLDAIAANPDVWAKTAFILNYDENDGIFDHVAPPVPPPGTPKEFVKGLPIGGGFRVPCIIASPWTAGGWVCSQPFDHTSVLQFLERWTGVAEPNITDWRRKTFGDLTAAFRFDDGLPHPPDLPDTVHTLSRAHEAAYLPKPTLPGGDQETADAGEGRAQARPAGTGMKEAPAASSFGAGSEGNQSSIHDPLQFSLPFAGGASPPWPAALSMQAPAHPLDRPLCPCGCRSVAPAIGPAPSGDANLPSGRRGLLHAFTATIGFACHGRLTEAWPIATLTAAPVEIRKRSTVGE